MAVKVSVDGGTNAGNRPPFDPGHAPTCQCSRCEQRRKERR